MNPSSCMIPAENAAVGSAQPVRVRRPRYSVHASGDAFVVEVLLPGARKESVEVHLHEDILTVTATRPSAPEGWNLRERETPLGDYRLSLRLNVAIDQAGIQANVEDGVLTLRLPKSEALKPRTIAVQ